MIYYYKCLGDCLEVIATMEKLPNDAQCAVCGGSFSFMGKVERDHLVREEDRTPCNTLCTHASGPRCDCRCGGENHGTGRIVKVKIINGIPVVDAFDYDKAVKRMVEFRPKRSRIVSQDSLILKIFDAMRRYYSSVYRSEHFESSQTFYQLRFYYRNSFNKQLKKLRKMKSHFHRIKVANSILELQGFTFEELKNKGMLEIIRQGNSELYTEYKNVTDVLAF